jgi:hypothetical protein
VSRLTATAAVPLSAHPLRRCFAVLITYSTIESANLSKALKSLSTTNTSYNSSISSLLNKEPTYVVLASNSEDISVSFLHVRALCLVLPQFPQRRRAS